MIKAPYSLLELDGMAERFYDLIEDKFQLISRIQNRPHDLLSPFFNLIQPDIPGIIKGKPDELEKIINKLTTTIDACKSNYQVVEKVSEKRANSWFKEEVFKIFNYSYNNNSFIKRNRGEIAYGHSKMLNINTCLYCNIQFTHTVIGNNKKTRPHFDHFYCKSKYPYLALSFYNLIPSCYPCNSSIKGAKSFFYSTHLHPFIDSIDGLYKFKTNVKSSDFLVNEQEFDLELVPTFNKSSQKNKAITSIADLEIIDRYKVHKDYACDIIKTSYAYNETKIRELLENYTIRGEPVFKNESEILELLYGNYISPEKLHLRILSKLTKDIAEEFDIKL